MFSVYTVVQRTVLGSIDGYRIISIVVRMVLLGHTHTLTHTHTHTHTYIYIYIYG